MSEFRKKHIAIFFSTFLFLFCGGYIFLFFDWVNILNQIGSVNFAHFFFNIFFIHISYVLVRAIRLMVLVGYFNPLCKIFSAYIVTAVFVGVASFTPGQIGEMGKIEILNRYGNIDRKDGVLIFFIEKVFDLFAILSFFLFGILFADLFFHINFAIKILFSSVLILFSILIFNRIKLKFFYRYNINTYFYVFIITLLSWVLVGFAWKISFSGVGIELSIVDVFIHISFVTLGSLLSFVPGGIGISEVLISEILSKAGIGASQAQSAALMIRIYGIFTLVFGVIHIPLLIKKLTKR